MAFMGVFLKLWSCISSMDIMDTMDSMDSIDSKDQHTLTHNAHLNIVSDHL